MVLKLLAIEIVPHSSDGMSDRKAAQLPITSGNPWRPRSWQVKSCRWIWNQWMGQTYSMDGRMCFVGHVVTTAGASVVNNKEKKRERYRLQAS